VTVVWLILAGWLLLLVVVLVLAYVRRVGDHRRAAELEDRAVTEAYLNRLDEREARRVAGRRPPERGDR
jgi:hypothetical protein